MGAYHPSPPPDQVPPGVRFVQGATLRPSTSAQSRGAGWGRATHAHTGQPGVPTAGGPMGRGRMPALSSERHASQPGGRGHHPRHVGRGGLPMRPSLSRQRPRSPREGREWVRRGSRRGKREGRLRLPWRRGSRRLGGGHPNNRTLLPGGNVRLGPALGKIKA